MSTTETDTFLLAHHILPLSYSFSEPISPISIRDQMIRAKMFIEHAISAKLLTKTRKLFVVGGGAAGASLAIEAAGRGVSVVLIEKENDSFNLQPSATAAGSIRRNMTGLFLIGDQRIILGLRLCCPTKHCRKWR